MTRFALVAVLVIGWLTLSDSNVARRFPMGWFDTLDRYTPADGRYGKLSQAFADKNDGWIARAQGGDGDCCGDGGDDEVIDAFAKPVEDQTQAKWFAWYDYLFVALVVAVLAWQHFFARFREAWTAATEVYADHLTLFDEARQQGAGTAALMRRALIMLAVPPGVFLWVLIGSPEFQSWPGKLGP